MWEIRLVVADKSPKDVLLRDQVLAKEKMAPVQKESLVLPIRSLNFRPHNIAVFALHIDEVLTLFSMYATIASLVRY